MDGPEFGQPFGGYPPATALRLDARGAQFLRQCLEPAVPVRGRAGGAAAGIPVLELRLGQETELQQTVVQLVRIPGLNPCFGAHLVNGVHRDDAELRRIGARCRALAGR